MPPHPKNGFQQGQQLCRFHLVRGKTHHQTAAQDVGAHAFHGGLAPQFGVQDMREALVFVQTADGESNSAGNGMLDANVFFHGDPAMQFS